MHLSDGQEMGLARQTTDEQKDLQVVSGRKGAAICAILYIGRFARSTLCGIQS